MHWHIHALGHLTEPWINEGIATYSKRFTHPYSLHLITYPTPKRTANTDIDKLQKQEHALLTQSLKPSDLVICLDERGKTYSSQAFAKQLATWQNRSNRICFLLGGPDGHHDSTRHEADALLSLSPLTMPHGLARLVLVEQLYRAMSLQKNHPYHR